MKLNVLFNKIAWFGKYSGYECIVHYLPECKISYFNASDSSLIKKIKGKYYQHAKNIHDQSTYGLATGMSFLNAASRADASHILYLETHIHLLKVAGERQLSSLAGTIHLPFSQWKQEQLDMLVNLKHPLILYESEMEKFQAYLPKGQLKFIRHGVDNDFFRPGDKPRNKKRILCVGHYLRNFDMLQRVVAILSGEDKELEFHLVIPGIHRNLPALNTLAANPNVYFHEKLTDEQLLHLYQECAVLLMPMTDSGANTAIVQGIACGIPVVTTNMGGITSYGGNDVFPLVENNDDKPMADLVLRYLSEDAYMQSISSATRAFSEAKLDWKLTAAEHYAFYRSLAKK